MRFRLTAACEAEGTAPESFVVEMDDYRVGFELEGGKLTEVWVEMPVSDFHAHLPQLKREESSLPSISLSDPPEAGRLLELLQYVESLGSFWFAIRRLAWQEAKYSWIPDSPAEQAALSISAFQRRLSYPDNAVPFDIGIVQRLLARRPSLEYLVPPMAFYREGVTDHRAHRYITAFYNFYFFLEYLYAGGKFKSAQVTHAFRSSAQLVKAFDEAFAQMSTIEEHRRELRALTSALRCEFTSGGMIDFMVAIRGQLHHVTARSPRPQGTPLNHRRFRAVSFFSLAVCLQLVPRLANGTPLEAVD